MGGIFGKNGQILMKKSQLKKGKPLTDTIVESLKAEIQEYSVTDTTKGLYLFVKPTGSKSWKMKYKDGKGKWRWHGLGSYPKVSLANARLATHQKYKELALGANELTAPKKAPKDTLADVLAIYQAEPSYQKLADSSKARDQSTLSTHILPIMGNRILREITRADWLKLFKTIGEKVHHITKKPTVTESKRAYILINRLYNFAMNESIAGVESNPVTGLDARLPTHTPQPQAHIGTDELPNLIGKLHTINSDQTRIGLLLLAHLFLRPTEVLDSFWCEIDFENALWHIPSERMKKRKAHTVPLSHQVILLLQELHAITGDDDRLFPYTTTDRKQGRAKFMMTLKRLGFNQTLHGFRHIASTTLNNHTDENGNKFDERVIETALAHSVQGVKGVYNRAEYLDDRRKLMQWYSDFLENLAQMGQV